MQNLNLSASHSTPSLAAFIRGSVGKTKNLTHKIPLTELHLRGERVKSPNLRRSHKYLKQWIRKKKTSVS